MFGFQVYAAGTAIEASLKQLAERRTDIFGVGDEETVIGKKLLAICKVFAKSASHLLNR